MMLIHNKMQLIVFFMCSVYPNLSISEFTGKKFNWLTDNLVSKLIEYDRRGELAKIIDVNVRNFLAPGSNFASDVSRMTVKFSGNLGRSHLATWILKTSNAKNNEPKGKEFLREIEIRRDVTPKVDKMLRFLGHEYVSSIFPKYAK